MVFRRQKPDRATWMSAYKTAYVDAGGHPGQVDWDTAQFLYDQRSNAEDVGRERGHVESKRARENLEQRPFLAPGTRRG